MKRKIKFKILLLLSVLPVGLYAQNPHNELSLIVDNLYAVFNDSGRPGCAVAIVKKGEVVYKKCFGLSDIEHPIPVTDSTRFNLASVSKQFTGYGIAKLIVETELHPNDVISQYLHNENNLWDSIQLRNLIHHTSGVWEWPYLFLAAGYSFNDVLNHQSIYKIIKSQTNLIQTNFFWAISYIRETKMEKLMDFISNKKEIIVLDLESLKN